MKLVKKIVKSDKSYPEGDKEYKTAHRDANKLEKAKYPKGFKELDKIIKEKLGKNEYLGTHNKDNKIEISKKVPKKYRKEVLFHEEVERTKENQLDKRKKK